MNRYYRAEEPVISDPYYSIVIPAYNEERRIGDSLKRITTFLAAQPQPAEIVVVDDGSRDGTVAVCQAAQPALPAHISLEIISYRPNAGKGWAVRQGCLAARGRYILFSDADLATPIEEATKLWTALDEGSDLAIGTRIHADGRDMRSTQPLYRRLMGKLYSFFAGLLVLRGIRDTQCGFKAFTRDAAHYLFAAQQLPSIVFDTEVLFLAQRSGLQITQVPVVWSDVGGSRMRMTLSQALRVLRDLISIKARHVETPLMAVPVSGEAPH